MYRFYFLSLLSFLLLAGCSSDDNTTPAEVQKYLKLSTSLKSHAVGSRAPLTQFSIDDRLGVFATDGAIDQPYSGSSDNLNFPIIFNGSSWSHKEIELKDAPMSLYSYYPYSGSINNSILPIDANKQIDYLYGIKATASKDKVTADVTMRHALSLVSFIIKKNDYQHEGRVTKIEIKGLQTTGELDIITGKITKTGDVTSVSEEFNYVLDDSNLQRLSVITLPTNIADYEEVVFYITIDDDEFQYTVSTEHNWLAEYEYIYSLNLNKTVNDPLLPEDTQLDVVYWSSFGKDDLITLGNARTSQLRISPNYVDYGRTYVKGEAGYFGTFGINNYTEDWEGKIRMALYDGDRLVEQYQPYNIEITKEFFDGWNIPCYINCAPGTYTLKPLFQAKGETEWIHPRFSGDSSADDWIVTILESYDVPRCRNFNLKRKTPADSQIFDKKYDTPFDVEIKLINKSDKPLKGEIKAVYHRTFGEFHSQSLNDGNTWEDEIGRISIDMPISNEIQKYDMSCCITQRRDYPNKYVPAIHIYFKADGSDTWDFINVDCDVTLEALKDVTENQIIGEDGFYSIGGLGWVLARERSVNYIYVKPG